jgi:hypothetical protein
MHMKNIITDLPKNFSFKDSYSLLSDTEKRKVREAICELGISKETFHRWLREDRVPPVWREHFKEHLNVYLNAKGANIA